MSPSGQGANVIGGARGRMTTGSEAKTRERCRARAVDRPGFVLGSRQILPAPRVLPVAPGPTTFVGRRSPLRGMS
jgi:hypothetical protein